jgi:hypothetical protein
MIVMVCEGDAITGLGPVGCYLKSYDPDGNKGFGDIRWTHDVAEAKRFNGTQAATDEWMRRSTVNPIRDDGRPNRPLTMYSVSFQPAKDS